MNKIVLLLFVLTSLGTASAIWSIPIAQAEQAQSEAIQTISWVLSEKNYNDAAYQASLNYRSSGDRYLTEAKQSYDSGNEAGAQNKSELALFEYYRAKYFARYSQLIFERNETSQIIFNFKSEWYQPTDIFEEFNKSEIDFEIAKYQAYSLTNFDSTDLEQIKRIVAYRQNSDEFDRVMNTLGTEKELKTKLTTLTSKNSAYDQKNREYIRFLEILIVSISILLYLSILFLFSIYYNKNKQTSLKKFKQFGKIAKYGYLSGIILYVTLIFSRYITPDQQICVSIFCFPNLFGFIIFALIPIIAPLVLIIPAFLIFEIIKVLNPTNEATDDMLDLLNKIIQKLLSFFSDNKKDQEAKPSMQTIITEPKGPVNVNQTQTTKQVQK
ncbi:MAG: hypothetical protein AABY04_01390 [Candidatus Micrarchaeota archaeon]